MDQQSTPNRSAIGQFYSDLLRLDSQELNTIAIKDYPKWARRIIDAERKRRKTDGDNTPTKAEKSRILSIGEGKQSAAKIATANDSQLPLTPKRQPNISRKKFDGEFLHEDVADALPDNIYYDKRLSPSVMAKLSVFGMLQCERPSCRNRWASGICATVLEYSRPNRNYRTTIYSQKCRECLDTVEPVLDTEAYARRIRWMIDLWIGNRKAVKQPKGKTPQGPHEEELCHACEVGVCPWEDRSSR